jgi:hypothetical protein
MVYNYISTHFYVTCLVLYAWYKVNLETLTFFGLLYHVFTLWTDVVVLYPDKDEEQDEGFLGRIWVMVGGCRGIFYKGFGKESSST